MTLLNLEPFSWLWSLHSRFHIASLMKTAFCCFPSCLLWQWEVPGAGGARRQHTSHQWFLHMGGGMVLLQEKEFPCLREVRDHMNCLADHLLVSLHSSISFQLSMPAALSLVEQGQSLCVHNYWISPKLFKTNALVNVKTLSEKIFYFETLNILKCKYQNKRLDSYIALSLLEPDRTHRAKEPDVP